MKNAICIENITKKYGDVVALNDVSLQIHEGELFGLIGPDGAGKTSLFRILTTLISPTSGKASVLGYDTVKDIEPIRNNVGYMPGRFSLYQDLSVEENLSFFASLFGKTVEESYELIEPIYKQIEPFKTRRAGKLSGGMKQKLALSCALIHKPKVLFLDEPTTGVDAVSRSEFWDMLQHLKKHGITILVSTPYMDEASRCDRIALCNQGKILSVDTPENMIREFKEPLFAVSSKDLFKLLNLTRKYKHTRLCYPFGGVHHILADGEFTESELLQHLQNNGIKDATMERITPCIEDIFINLMQK